MPAKTPRAAGAPVSGRPGLKFVADALADNLRAYRFLGRLEQQDVADRMRQLHHPWRRVTVSEVERGRRNVTVPELLTLALILGATVQELLDPRRVDQRDMPGQMYLALNPDTIDMPISSEYLPGLLTRDKFDVQPMEFHDGTFVMGFDRVDPEEGEPS
jgi:transcriptional regulator with XRE-family HTH domain